MDFNRKVNRVLSLSSKRAGRKSLKFYLSNYTKEGTQKEGFVRWADRKNEEKYKKKKLFKTGKMKKSFMMFRPSNHSFKIVNSTSYAIYHQEGTERMPQREILYESEKLNDEVEKEMNKEIQKMMKKLFK